MRICGWLILVILLEALLLFAWLLPADPAAVVYARTFIGGIAGVSGPLPLTDWRMEVFAFFIACPGVVLAALLIKREW